MPPIFLFLEHGSCFTHSRYISIASIARIATAALSLLISILKPLSCVLLSLCSLLLSQALIDIVFCYIGVEGISYQ